MKPLVDYCSTDDEEESQKNKSIKENLSYFDKINNPLVSNSSSHDVDHGQKSTANVIESKFYKHNINEDFHGIFPLI